MLKNLFVSEVRVRILELFLLNHEKSLHVRGVVRSVGAEINAIRRELDNLAAIELLTRRQSSNRIYYKVNVLHPFFNELTNMAAKETGIARQIISRQQDLGKIRFAVLCPAIYKGRASTALDVDLFVVGDIKMDVLEKLVRSEEEKSARELNYSVMTEEEFKSRKRTGDQFISRVLSQSRMMLVGDEEKFYSVV
jgi:hypothetical protein